MGLLLAGRPRFAPCTSAGIQQMLVRSGIDPAGIVRGNAGTHEHRRQARRRPAGPARRRRERDGYGVPHAHPRSWRRSHVAADIVIAAIGVPRFLTADMVSDGVVVIDVGINRIDAPERRSGYRLVGDVDYAAVRQKASAITPVPGGVGPMTIAMLLSNTLKAARLSIHPELR